MKEDEARLMRFFIACADAGGLENGTVYPHMQGFVHDAVGMNEKRACGIYEKWFARNWADCGVSVRTAWVTQEGIEGMRRTLADGQYRPEYGAVTEAGYESAWADPRALIRMRPDGTLVIDVEAACD